MELKVHWVDSEMQTGWDKYECPKEEKRFAVSQGKFVGLSKVYLTLAGDWEIPGENQNRVIDIPVSTIRKVFKIKDYEEIDLTTLENV